MREFPDRRPVSTLRLVARILGTVIGLMALFGVIEGLDYNLAHPEEATVARYLVWAGFVAVFAGCVVGWFKELAASLLILGGIALLVVIALLVPSEFRQAYFLIIPAVPGFLFLYVHLAGKREKQRRTT